MQASINWKRLSNATQLSIYDYFSSQLSICVCISISIIQMTAVAHKSCHLSQLCYDNIIDTSLATIDTQCEPTWAFVLFAIVTVIGFFYCSTCVWVCVWEDSILQIAIVAQNSKWLPLFVCLAHTYTHRVVAAPKIMLTKAFDDKERKKIVRPYLATKNASEKGKRTKKNRRKIEENMKNCEKRKKKTKTEKTTQNRKPQRAKTVCKKKLHICLGFLILHQMQRSGVVQGRGGGAEGGIEAGKPNKQERKTVTHAKKSNFWLSPRA